MHKVLNKFVYYNNNDDYYLSLRLCGLLANSVRSYIFSFLITYYYTYY